MASLIKNNGYAPDPRSLNNWNALKKVTSNHHPTWYPFSGPGELLETPQDMMFKACSTIAERQMSLSQAKIQLEVQESMARERIKSLVKCVEQLARYGHDRNFIFFTLCKTTITLIYMEGKSLINDHSLHRALRISLTTAIILVRLKIPIPQATIS